MIPYYFAYIPNRRNAEWCIPGISKDLWLLINSLEMGRLVTGMSTLDEHLREIIVLALDESLCIFEKRRCNSFTNACLFEHRETVFTIFARKTAKRLFRRSLPNIAINSLMVRTTRNLARSGSLTYLAIFECKSYMMCSIIKDNIINYLR